MKLTLISVSYHFGMYYPFVVQGKICPSIISYVLLEVLPYFVLVRAMAILRFYLLKIEMLGNILRLEKSVVGCLGILYDSTCNMPHWPFGNGYR